MSKKIIYTNKAPAAIGPYSQAVKVDKTLYISGQIPIDPEHGEIISQDFKEQVTQIFKNLQAILEEAGGSITDLVKVNAYLTNLSLFKDFNEIMANTFTEPYPARAAVEVSRLPKDVLVEVEGIAVIE